MDRFLGPAAVCQESSVLHRRVAQPAQRAATQGKRARLGRLLLQPVEVGEHVRPELLEQVRIDRVQGERLGVAFGRPTVALGLPVGGDGAAVLFDGRLKCRVHVADAGEVASLLVRIRGSPAAGVVGGMDAQVGHYSTGAHGTSKRAERRRCAISAMVVLLKVAYKEASDRRPIVLGR